MIPVKPLAAAKTRLRGAADHGVGDPVAHARLALALAQDTVAAARSARHVRRLLVITSDPVVAAQLAADHVEVVPDGLVAGLNATLEHGAVLLRARDPGIAVGALQADLPALTSAELDEAVEAAGLLTRAFCADAVGTGTTLLLAAPGVPLQPLFGEGSARRHLLSGASPLSGKWPGLRRDVDIAEDLCRAAELGLGAHTSAVLTRRQG